MSYTIKDIAKMMNVSTYTLRYYDKEGLFPNVKRVNGIRIFEEKDFEWLRVLNCLKNINIYQQENVEFTYTLFVNG